MFSEAVQNKNVLMLITAGIYILAVFATLSGHILLFSVLVSILFLFIIIKNLMPVKYLFIWCLVFYLGIMNTSFRLKETDNLLNLAPVNSEITGTI